MCETLGMRKLSNKRSLFLFVDNTEVVYVEFFLNKGLYELLRQITGATCNFGYQRSLRKLKKRYGISGALR